MIYDNVWDDQHINMDHVNQGMRGGGGGDENETETDIHVPGFANLDV